MAVLVQGQEVLQIQTQIQVVLEVVQAENKQHQGQETHHQLLRHKVILAVLKVETVAETVAVADEVAVNATLAVPVRAEEASTAAAAKEEKMDVCNVGGGDDDDEDESGVRQVLAAVCPP